MQPDRPGETLGWPRGNMVWQSTWIKHVIVFGFALYRASSRILKTEILFLKFWTTPSGPLGWLHYTRQNQLSAETHFNCVFYGGSDWAIIELRPQTSLFTAFCSLKHALLLGGDVAQDVLLSSGKSEGCRFDPTLGVSKCPWARHLTPNCSWWAGWYLAWQPIAVGVREKL